jgi:hypothetical protein
MTNSLDLDPEWGAIDLLEEVEETFGIKIANEEAERCATLGDLYAVLCAHTPGWNSQDGKCASSMVFYRIRRSLDPQKKSDVTPRTPLMREETSVFRLFKAIGKGTGLRLPSPRMTMVGLSGLTILVACLIGGIIALLEGRWAPSGALFLFGLLGIPLLRLERGHLPVGIATVGALARRTVSLNSGRLSEGGWRPSDRWSILVSLAAEHSELPPDEMTPATFFHRRSLEMARAP